MPTETATTPATADTAPPSGEGDALPPEPASHDVLLASLTQTRDELVKAREELQEATRAFGVLRPRIGPGMSTNMPRTPEDAGAGQLRIAATRAAVTGDRRALMDYLRLRRAAV